MKRILLFLLCLIYFNLSWGQHKDFFKVGHTYTYECVSYDETPIQNIGERTFFLFWLEDSILKGRFNGTTDEFETAREGYTPGYIVAPLTDLKEVNDSTLSFTLMVRIPFNCEIPLFIKNEEEARTLGYPLWVQTWHPSTASIRKYIVTFSDSMMRIHPDGVYDKWNRWCKLIQ